MIPIKVFLTIAILPLLFLGAYAQTSIAIKDVTLIDMATGKLRSGTTVLVIGNRIAAIGPRLKTSKAIKVIDGRGKFLIPGLWDMHVHALSKDRIDQFSKLFLANGVTGVRDTGTTAEGFAMLGPL
ncbi:MAG TPA: hypothetical protein VMZ26_15080, partial [Pyrinomonadaceae bacterium]|nr:hypothetical protein [Pyrinomonadaceae bacterium]